MTSGLSKRNSHVLLLAGIAVFILMTLALAAISEDVVNRERITVVDAQLSQWLHAHGSPQLTTMMFAATFFGSTRAVVIITIAFGIYLIIKRRYFWLTAVGCSVFGGMALNKILKFIFHRPRPHFDDPLLSLTSYSFPSGHTMLATVLYGVIAAYLFASIKSWPSRTAIGVTASALILLVAFSRIYLGAHYLTDVMGAMAEGFAWLSLCLSVVYWGQDYFRG